ncbi:PLDc N-terminal domain-containing protein [Planctomonas psychrotolerans]|uniref:PLDc N-terminal domain-containing protein n=1 Tax=Planctomonas psychrotolerans TaxID=2528712 RepID=UPI001D0D2BF9|nr:PLDc N-terminal domain-containing protein [Planctomonas psychrotolerans]
MIGAVNPLLPADYDIAWTATAIVPLVLMVFAIVSISRLLAAFTPALVLGWTLLVVLVPVIGPLAWFLIGRRSVLADRWSHRVP